MTQEAVERSLEYGTERRKKYYELYIKRSLCIAGRFKSAQFMKAK
jgi:hypothetical protein